MTDDSRARRVKEEIERVDRELEKLDEDEKRREEKKLTIEEEIRTKSKILSRPMIEDIGGRKKLSGDGGSGDDGPSRGSWAGDALGVTGTSPSTAKAPQMVSAQMPLLKEAVIRHWDSYLKEKDRASGRPKPLTNMPMRLWLASNMQDILEERMLSDLKKLEDASPYRMSRLRELNMSREALTHRDAEELRRLEDAEAARYWLRERLLRRVPLEEQEEITWLGDLGGGAFGVLPYTVLMTWDLMTPKERIGARWHADNQLLRWQTQVVGQFIPKTPSLAWFREKARKGIETLFDDWNEEIYSDKKWAEMVKKGQAQLDDLEEELTGFDQFTVEEERKIQQMYTDYIRREETLAAEQEQLVS